MGSLDLSATMDAIAEVLVSEVTTRVYAYPTDSVQVPCIVIGYPETITFDYTFDGGSDQAIFPVWYVAGRVIERTTRDELSRIVSGATAVKAALDGNLDGAVNASTVTDAQVEEINVGAVAYAAVKFNVQIIS